jgi:RNA polymerase sigma factor (sigma-70 family)
MESPDSLLVARTLAGDKTAFGLLVERHGSLAFRLAYRMLGSTAEAEDVTQESCLQAFLGLERLQDADRFAPWLCGIAVNLSRLRLRTRWREFPLETWEGGRWVEGFTRADLQPSPEAAQESRELHQVVLDAIAMLPGEQQAAVRLHYFDGLPLSEIAALVGAPLGTVKARLHRARHRLRAQLLHQAVDRDADRRREKTQMIEMNVYDVLARLRLKEGQPENHPTHPARIVILKERQGERIMPIWVGPFEGDEMVRLLVEKSTVRPLTFELIARLLTTAQMRLDRVAVTRLHEEIFYATLWVTVGGETHEIDARPSDALSLALRVKAPIFVTEDVLEKDLRSRDWISTEAFMEKLASDLRESAEEAALPEWADVGWQSGPEFIRSLPS